MSKRAAVWLGLAGCVWLGANCGAQAPVRVGALSGGEFRVRGQMEVAADGKAMLMSGSQLEVTNGTTRLLFAGGEARLCGPLKVTVLKSATAAAERGEPDDLPLLFALDSGAIEIEYDAVAAHTVQSAFFGISSVPAGKQVRKLAVRLSAGGTACVAAMAGSLRVREQIGTAEMMIPPGRAMRIPAAGVEKAEAVVAAECGCAPAPTAAAPAPATTLTAETATIVKPAAEAGPQTKTTIAAAPLVYDAAQAAAQPGFTKEPEITLPVVRSAPPSETQAEPARQPAAPAATRTAQPAPKPSAPQKASGFRSRIKRFFRVLLGY